MLYNFLCFFERLMRIFFCKTICMISILIGLVSPYCLAQNSWNDIDLCQIQQKKVREMVAALQNEKNTGLYELEPTCKPGQILEGYRELESSYRIKGDMLQVWECYTSTSPAKSWNGRTVSFGLLISKYRNTLLYRNEDLYTGVDTGQVIYVNLRIMRGLYNLAVGFEIISVDPVNRSITFSYLKGGKSRGRQTIYFKPADNGYTDILHHTSFKSNSYLRDHFIYPHFHKILINEFHRNMRNIFLKDTTLFVPENPE
jgi:hypothetical protein